ncbi:MAG: hypothetical protein GX602_05325 [Dehalococcoidales bacterium]|nr:hypothetical protein [Dehalococcoidales bacterium]
MAVAGLLLFFPFIQTTECHANSAEPPSIFIIVAHAPEDLEISLLPEGPKASKTTHSYETYYSFYSYQMQFTDYSFEVATGGKTFIIELDKPVESYQNIYTLDLKSQSLTPGKSFYRSAFLIFSRVVLTLLVEGLVFFLFGYRRKRSWLVFLGLNLATQLTLWICLNGTPPFHVGYLVLLLFFAEALIFIIEMAGFLILVNEHRRLRTAAYVIVANILSLLAGISLISALPI